MSAEQPSQKPGVDTRTSRVQRVLAVSPLVLRGRTQRSDVDIVATVPDPAADACHEIFAVSAALQGTKPTEGQSGGASIYDLAQWPLLASLPASAVIVLDREQFAITIANKSVHYMGVDFDLDIDPDAIRTLQEDRIIELEGVGAGRRVTFFMVVLSTDAEIWSDKPIVDEVLLSPKTLTDFLALPVVPGVVGRPFRAQLSASQTAELMFSGGTVVRANDGTVLRIVVSRDPEDLLRPGDKSVQFIWSRETLLEKDSTRRLLETIDTLRTASARGRLMMARPVKSVKHRAVRLGVCLPASIEWQVGTATGFAPPVLGDGGLVRSAGNSFLGVGSAPTIAEVGGALPRVAGAVAALIDAAATRSLLEAGAAVQVAYTVTTRADQLMLVAFVPFDTLVTADSLGEFILGNYSFIGRLLTDPDLRAGLQAYLDVFAARSETEHLRRLEAQVVERGLKQVSNLLEPKPIRDQDFEFDPAHPNQIEHAKLKPRPPLPEIGANRLLNAGAAEAARLATELTRERISRVESARRFFQYMLGRRTYFSGQWLLQRDNRMDLIYRLAESAGCGLEREWSSGQVLGLSGSEVIVAIRSDLGDATSELHQRLMRFSAPVDVVSGIVQMASDA